MKLVMIAGPNDPEIVDFETLEGKKALVEAIMEIGVEDVDLWHKFDGGRLVEGHRTRVEVISADDAFVYFRGHWRFWDDNSPAFLDISADWDERR